MNTEASFFSSPISCTHQSLQTSPFFLKNFEVQTAQVSFKTVILSFDRVGGRLSTWMYLLQEEDDKPNVSGKSTLKFLEVNCWGDKPSGVKIARSISLETMFFSLF